jgi:signal transduction histidine kinase
LRTPLSAVLGWTEILLTKPLDQTANHRALQTIERNARKQLLLIEDLLDVSRIGAGHFRLYVHSINLADVIEAAIDVLRPAIEAKGLRLQTNIEKTAPPVSGDERRLQQVIWNLLSNAVKFTPESGLIGVRLDHTSSHARIIVRDTGSGISPEFLPHAFERFRQGDPARTKQHDGLGLGLAIARHLIELHGGTIQGNSGGEGQGAEFTIQLPLEHATERVSVEQHQIASISAGV